MTTNMNLFIFILIAVLAIIIVRVFIRRKSPRKQMAEHENNQVYVGNLPYEVGEDQLQQYFTQFGNVHQVKLVKNHKTGQSKGYAFVTFDSTQQARHSLGAHGDSIFGRNMVVRIAKPR